MTDSFNGRSTEPDGAPRIAGLDTLRGIAILGILFMNINDMGASLWASFDDPGHIGWSRADQVVWFVREVFADGTARCLLEMLFGVGMVILTDRAAQAADDRVVRRRYYTRNLVLLGFGLAHVFVLLWPGDILHSYALAALIAFWFRRLSARWLLAIGLSIAVLQLVGGGIGYVQTSFDAAATNAARAKQASGARLTTAERTALRDAATEAKARAERQAKLHDMIAEEDAARRGTFLTWASAQWETEKTLQSRGIELGVVWEAVATMLVGAALFRWGVIQGGRSRGFYLRLTLIAYAAGLGARSVGAAADVRGDSGPNIMWSLGEAARLATTLGHVGLVYLLLGTAVGAKLLRPFGAAGRTALSIYIAQTLICLWVLYPPFMLGLYGTQGWAELMGTALAINICLLIGANWWVRHYRVAPVEWAWRSLAEGRRLPFRKQSGMTLPA